MKKKLISGSIAIALVAATGIIYAAGQPVTHTFTANTVAKASEVNANFQDLADRIEVLSNANTYDYKDYETPDTITKTTFTVTMYLQDPSDTTITQYDTETRDISRTVSGSTETVVVTRKRFDGGESGTRKHHQKLKYTKTDDSTVFNGRDVYNNSDTLTRTETLTPGITQRTGNMVMGQAWVDGFSNEYDDKVGSTDHTSYGVQTTFTGGTDTLTVLGNANIPCIKVHVNRQSDDFGTFQQVNWYCEGYGLSKQIEVRSNYSYTMVLSARE